jgi:uncharacterized Zn finger protein (UPF0148 family)
MALETVTNSCPECGSGKFTESKPGSYVCAYCGVTRLAPAGTAVGCEIDCGVPAIGRCRSCGRAFCTTHGRGDSCAPCYDELAAKKDANAAKKDAKALETKMRAEEARTLEAERRSARWAQGRRLAPLFLTAMDTAGRPGAEKVYGFRQGPWPWSRLRRVVTFEGWIVFTEEKVHSMLTMNGVWQAALRLGDGRLWQDHFIGAEYRWGDAGDALLTIAAEHGVSLPDDATQHVAD